MPTYEDAHAGDLVLGHDGQVWGVETKVSGPPLAVTLVRYEARVTGYPPPGTEVEIVQRADVSAEAMAAQAFIDAGIDVEIVGERWAR